MAKILIIEDDPLTVKIYATRLSADAHEVQSANNGEDGLKLVQEFQPHLVLLDLMMPKLDGLALLEKLKENPATKKIPVLVYSNLSSEEKIKKAKQLGAVDFLVKASLTPTQVMKRIEKYL